MTPTYDLLISLGVALALGLLIGIEREMVKLRGAKNGLVSDFSGLRSYTLISLLGFVAAYSASVWGEWIFVATMIVTSSLTLISYKQESSMLRLFGITSELAAFLTFFIGAIASVSSLLATILGVAVVMILSMKNTLRGFIEKMKPEEFFDTVKFVIIAFVVLPLLPNRIVDPWGFFNPYKIWLIVVFISAIGFVGYILTKALGSRKGLGLTGLVGGLASSTAVTNSMAEQSKSNAKLSNAFTFAVVIASTMMFARVGLEVFVLNRELLLSKLFISLSALLVVSGGVMLWLWKAGNEKAHNQKAKDLKLSSPFKLIPAMKFGAFYVFILVVTYLANLYLGKSGIYIASAFSGLADVDAITISLSRLAHNSEITAEVATKGITLAVIVNTFVKLAIIRLFGSRDFFRKAVVAFGIIIAGGLAAIILL
ncbi:MAG: MgtC/SapB family protein [Candidatus Gracilibacteria bacterium]|jgi:uncharacterized membrane protein (DUF4010 family)